MYINEHTKLTLLSPNVIKISLWVVVGLSFCLFARPVDNGSVKQTLLAPWDHAFGCQLLRSLGSATKFLGIWLLVGQHTSWGGGRGSRRDDYLITCGRRMQKKWKC